jgi:hypothetical protein
MNKITSGAKLSLILHKLEICIGAVQPWQFLL